MEIRLSAEVLVNSTLEKVVGEGARLYPQVLLVNAIGLALVPVVAEK